MMGEMSKKQIEFFVILIWLAVLTAIAILVIDFQIKGAIVEQAIKLREVVNGQKGETTASQRSDNNGTNNSPYPSDMVGSGHAGMEAGSTIPSATNNGNTVVTRTKTDGRAKRNTGRLSGESE
jgi:hypothetical protein